LLLLVGLVQERHGIVAEVVMRMLLAREVRVVVRPEYYWMMRVKGFSEGKGTPL